GDIYLDLAMGQKGVCRHRAFAFMVTALRLGIPTRLVHNEAHAWVEVRDDQTWHRIDLGGAALDLDGDPHLDRPQHVPPPDDFSWPAGRQDSGEQLADRDRQEALAERGEAGDAPPSSATGDEEPGEPGAPGEEDPSLPPGGAPVNEQPTTILQLDSIDKDIFRGLPMRLTGSALSRGQPCKGLRIDIVLTVDGEMAQRRLGSLSTDATGRFRGEVVVPPDIAVGDQELVLETAGNSVCGTGELR
ncbi:MAG: transglutaminase-like domain-containing protein, partial [Myxococcota bacterium]